LGKISVTENVVLAEAVYGSSSAQIFSPVQEMESTTRMIARPGFRFRIETSATYLQV